LDLVLGRPALDAQGGVVILVFHGSAGEWDTTETCARRAVLSSRRRKPGRAARQKSKRPEVSGLGRCIWRPLGAPGCRGYPFQDPVTAALDGFGRRTAGERIAEAVAHRQHQSISDG